MLSEIPPPNSNRIPDGTSQHIAPSQATTAVLGSLWEAWEGTEPVGSSRIRLLGGGCQIAAWRSDSPAAICESARAILPAGLDRPSFWKMNLSISAGQALRAQGTSRRFFLFSQIPSPQNTQNTKQTKNNKGDPTPFRNKLRTRRLVTPLAPKFLQKVYPATSLPAYPVDSASELPGGSAERSFVQCSKYEQI
jgi:hypothetical protein